MTFFKNSSRMRLATLALALGGIAGCSSQAVTSVIRPFRIDVRQGNYVSQHSIDQLQPGMTQDQVRFVMGSPMLVDIFHADRWDYVYQFSPGRGQEEHRRTSVFFVAGKLDRVEAGALPKEPDPASLPRVIDIDSPQG